MSSDTRTDGDRVRSGLAPGSLQGSGPELFERLERLPREPSTAPPGHPPDADVQVLDDAARALRAQLGHPHALDVWAGYLLRAGTLADEACLVVAATPGHVDQVRAVCPATYESLPVDVRAASIVEQLRGHVAALDEPSGGDDTDSSRMAAGASLDWIEEDMELLLHVGPERSWLVLDEFLTGARRRLVASLYAFHARHVARAVQQRLMEGARVKLVLGSQSGPPDGEPHEGGFDCAVVFSRWAEQWPGRFECAVAPAATEGSIANAHQINAAVRDEGAEALVWLSSGSWTPASQPLIGDAHLDHAAIAAQSGRREWHVVAQSPTLAERLRNHMDEDFRRCVERGSAAQATPASLLIDVPVAAGGATDPERPPACLLEPLQIVTRRVRIKPLLTHAGQSAVYCDAVLELIRSAHDTLLCQVPRIDMRGAAAGVALLVDALAERSRRIGDFRLILTSPINDLHFNMSQLKRRGVDLDRVRALPRTHVSGMVVDDARVLLGSHAWSSAGLTRNRGASLVFDDAEVAKYYRQAFELDWGRARPVVFDQRPEGERARPAAGDAPPPGFARMSLLEFLDSP